MRCSPPLGGQVGGRGVSYRNVRTNWPRTYTWLRYVLTRMVNGRSNARIDDLLPWKNCAARQRFNKVAVFDVIALPQTGPRRLALPNTEPMPNAASFRVGQK